MAALNDVLIQGATAYSPARGYRPSTASVSIRPDDHGQDTDARMIVGFAFTEVPRADRAVGAAIKPCRKARW